MASGDHEIVTRVLDLSVVIPALNEAAKIRGDVEAAAAFLAAQGLSGEIIVVDDGSTDGTAEEAGRARVPAGIDNIVICYEGNRGKGYAVRTGMKETRGKYTMFADSGLCIPFDNAVRGLDLLRGGACQIAHGSRNLRNSVICRPKPLRRRMLSVLFRLAARVVSGIPRRITDSQCGFKLYVGPVARKLYRQCVTDGFMFDVEILCRALRAGFAVREFPVEWSCDPDTRLDPRREWRPVLRDLVKIRRMLA
ncbi:MAG: glycosyltransferase [Kiritimatiellae bacterium]|nr:glycosyltransferase [Kiritimatiellia bacterium]